MECSPRKDAPASTVKTARPLRWPAALALFFITTWKGVALGCLGVSFFALWRVEDVASQKRKVNIFLVRFVRTFQRLDFPLNLIDLDAGELKAEIYEGIAVIFHFAEDHLRESKFGVFCCASLKESKRGGVKRLGDREGVHVNRADSHAGGSASFLFGFLFLFLFFRRFCYAVPGSGTGSPFEIGDFEGLDPLLKFIRGLAFNVAGVIITRHEKHVCIDRHGKHLQAPGFTALILGLLGPIRPIGLIGPISPP